MITLLAFLLSFTFASEAPTQKSLDTHHFDELLLKTCSSATSSATCQTRISEIRKKVDLDGLLSKAPKLGIDSKIQTVVISSPTKMIADYYCLAQFNGLIPKKDFEPEIFAYAVRGLSFIKNSEKQYSKWLSSSASKDCKKILSKIGLEPSSVVMDKFYQIILNPVAFLEAGAEDDFYSMAAMTYNHERLHAIFSLEKAESKSLKLWNKLSKGQQDQFQLEHSNYDFKNKKILAREFFSYTFENNPEKASDFLQGKYNKVDYGILPKELCNFCVSHDPKTLALANDLSLLGAKELLSRVEKDEVKVLILSTGRINTSPLFNWGQVRIDKGELNQITKLEGAMGKTLCRGERPESQDGITIVLAADSPYSTLIHEYLHVIQLRRDSSWCPISKQLWGKTNISAFEQRMIRDREWDVRLVLWNLLETSNVNVEDRLVVTDGLLSEASLRKSFDPEAIIFTEKNNLKSNRDRLIQEYITILNAKK